MGQVSWDNPKMIEMLAKRYIQKWKAGGNKAAQTWYAAFVRNDIREKVNAAITRRLKRYGKKLKSEDDKDPA